jgi:hypothetical protein
MTLRPRQLLATTLQPQPLGDAPPLDVPWIPPQRALELGGRHRPSGPPAPLLLGASDELDPQPEVHVSLPVGWVDRPLRALHLHRYLGGYSDNDAVMSVRSEPAELGLGSPRSSARRARGRADSLTRGREVAANRQISVPCLGPERDAPA